MHLSSPDDDDDADQNPFYFRLQHIFIPPRLNYVTRICIRLVAPIVALDIEKCLLNRMSPASSHLSPVYLLIRPFRRIDNKSHMVM